MQADAYRRARRLLSGSSGAVMARVLGVLHSLLVLALLTVLGLLISLLATRGVARYSTDRKDESPAWLAQKMGGQDARYTYYRDSGLFPLVAANRRSTNPAHRAAARGLRGVLRWIPILRNNNLGALTTLLATGLGLWLVHCVLAHHRRTLLAEAANAPATTLRRQIHRQMYRLGQSSLPTEGTGPADNLLTRAVNDVRDGIFAELDNAFRIPVLAAGLAGIALFLSVPLTLFLASLGALVWITARVMDRDARRHVAALPAARRPRATPNGARLRHGGHRQAAVRRAPRTLPRGRCAPDQGRGAAEPDDRPALWVRGGPGDRPSGPRRRGQAERLDRLGPGPGDVARRPNLPLARLGCDAPGDPPGAALGLRRIRVHRSEARAPAVGRGAVPGAVARPDQPGECDARESLRARPARRGLGRIPGRHPHRDHGP